jgi:predicted Zn-dependent protease
MNMKPSNLLRKLVAGAAALAMMLEALPVAAGSSDDGLAFIRDAEIEGLMRIYTRDVFKAAGLAPGAVHVYLINSSSINAFVAEGQRIFIHTGLLQQSKTPNEVIGVLAHETGHIAGGHLARMNNELAKASNMAIVSALLGAAAVVGAAMAGSSSGTQTGQALIMGGQSMAQRSMLAYARAQEASADQAAASYLQKTGQSGRGMLDLFQTLANQSIASTRYVSPYALTHPMPLERIRNLEQIVKKSPYFDKPDPTALLLRHELMQAKLFGFLNSAQVVYQKYPPSDRSLPARYARAIAAFRIGDLANAVPEIDTLIAEVPKNPYFWELKGQALLEGGRPAEAIAPLKEAVRLLPHNGLVNLMLAQSLVGTERPDDARAALAVLKVVQRAEPTMSRVHLLRAQAQARLGNIALAELSTAEAAALKGDKKLATEKAQRALKSFAEGSPEWLKANDILNYTKKDR